MKAHLILPAVVLLFAAGCSGPKPEFYWYHPGKTLAEAKVDYSACEVQAEQEAAKAVEARYFDRLRSPTALADGEQSRAKRESGDPALKARTEWGRLYKQTVFSGCMQSRGYVKLRKYQVSPGLKTKQLPMGAIAGRRK